MNQCLVFDLDVLFESGCFSNLDYHFAKSMARIFSEQSTIVKTSCALLSKALAQGHICLDLEKILSGSHSLSMHNDQKILFPDASTWKTELNISDMVSGCTETPLVLDDKDGSTLVYIARYYDFQNRLAENIASRVTINPSCSNEQSINRMIDSFFIGDESQVLCQKNAVKHAVTHPFTIISGGPGTGKTYVTSIIKQVLVKHAKEQNFNEPIIISLAPTGKAASKLDHGRTIHSVLKPHKNRSGFYHNKDNLLIIDVVIIDEASMIDIALLTRLMEAVPEGAKVILLGDQHQLSSVQAGSVLNDICSVHSLSDCIHSFEYNFRSQGQTGIEELSRAINSNNRSAIENLLTGNEYQDIEFIDQDSDSFSEKITAVIKTEYNSFVTCLNLEEALDHIDDFRVLCAVNSGRYGTLSISHLCENILRSDNNSGIPDTLFNQMIMVNTNDYQKGLFNGDTGIVIQNDRGWLAYFKRDEDFLKEYNYADLPSHDNAFAITIHKSQGSEFNTVLIIVPDVVSPVLTRQLLYTGVTRAKQKVIIAGNMNMILQAADHIVPRNSGLRRSLERNLSENNEKTDS